MEAIILTVNDVPKSKFQEDLKNFLVEKNFKSVKVDEDDELIMVSVSEESWRSIEFIENSETRIMWEELQYRYENGDR